MIGVQPSFAYVFLPPKQLGEKGKIQLTIVLSAWSQTAYMSILGSFLYTGSCIFIIWQKGFSVKVSFLKK